MTIAWHWRVSSGVTAATQRQDLVGQRSNCSRTRKGRGVSGGGRAGKAGGREDKTEVREETPWIGKRKKSIRKIGKERLFMR